MRKRFQKQPEVYRRIEWINVVMTHSLLVLMMGCVGLVISQVMRRLAPGWPYASLPWLCILISMEAMASWYITQRAADLEVSPITSLIIEWIVLLILLRLFLSLNSGVGHLFQEIPLWQRDFLGHFFDTQYVFFILLSAGVWGLTRFFVGDLAETRGDELIINVEAVGGVSSDRYSVRQRMATVILTIGFFLVALTALLFLDARYVSKVLYISRAGLLALIFYFLFGLALLSQVQFSVLRARWIWDRIDFDPGLLKRWTIFSLFFLALVSAVAFILPTGYSLGLLATLRYLLNILVVGLYAIFFVLAIPFVWLMSLLGKGKVQEQPPEQLPPPQMPQMPDQGPSAPVPWIEFLKSLLFWVIFLGLIGYAFFHYIRQNQALMEKLRKVRLFNWLAGTWKWFVGVLRGWNVEIGAAVQAGLQRLRLRRESAQQQLAQRFVNPRRMTPRQRVMFFYLAMVRRGSERGLPRQPDQTPAEYARLLHRNLEEVDQDIEAITGDFMEARYTRHEIVPDRAARVRQAWEHIKRALKERPERK
jgi:hypothetical protein